MRKGKFLNKISYLALVVLVTSNLTGCSIVRFEEIRNGVGVEKRGIPLEGKPTERTLDKPVKVLIDTTATYDDPLFDLQYRPIEKVEIPSKVERSSVSEFHISNPWIAIIIHVFICALIYRKFRDKYIRFIILVWIFIIDFFAFYAINSDCKYTEERPPRISDYLGEPGPIPPNSQISISLPLFQHPELKYKTDSDGILAITAKDISDKIRDLNPVLDTTHINIHTSVNVDGKAYLNTFRMGKSSGLFKVFKAAQGFSVLGTLSLEHEDGILSVSFSGNGKYLASGSKDRTIRIWRRDGSKFSFVGSLNKHKDRVLSVSFSENGKYLASGSEDRTIRFWRRDDSGSKSKFYLVKTSEKHKDGILSVVRSVSFSADGKYLAGGGEDGAIYLYAAILLSKSVQFVPFQTLEEHAAVVRSVSFSADGEYLASGDENGAIHIWQRSGSKFVRTLEEHVIGVRSVSFSGDGKYLASGSEDGAIHIWQRSGSKFVRIRTLEEHVAVVRSVSFSGDGKYLASGSEDQFVKILMSKISDEHPETPDNPLWGELPEEY